MYNPNYSEKAIPLVAVNENTGKYEMTQESINFLRSVPAPLGIVSVAGLYRTGKSYLLNRMLLNTNKPKQGFGVGPTINPCTKGLWCWGTPIKGKSQNGESINIIVIDTEGIGALDEDQTHDTRIFTLAILASSCFIYNSVGSIDQTAVQNLSLVVNLTKHIQLKSTNKSYDEEEDADQMAHYFPTFYWVVRDFSLQLQDPQGNAITSKDYLEKALAPLKGSSQYDDDIEEKNRIRKLLTSFFRDRDCFTMVRPLVDQTKLQDLDSIPFEQLRPDFIEQVIQFRKRVTQGLKIKTLNGKALNGDMYCNMLSSYVGAINDGAVPNIQNAWNYMCQEQCQKVQDECENLFDKELRDNMKFPVEEEYFDNTCENALETCLMYYRQKAIGDMSLSLKYQKELKEKIKEKVKLARQQNIKASKEFLQKKVLQVFNPIIEQLKKQHFKTFEEFEKTISSSYENLISNSPNLPYTKQKYLQLYKKVQRQGADYIFKCLNKQIQNMKAIFKEKEDFYVKQVESFKNDQESDRKNYTQKITQMDRDKIQTQNKIQRLQFELEKLIKQKESQTDKLSKNLSSKQNEFENSRKQLENKLQDLEQKYEQVTRNFTKEQKIWQKDKAIMENKVKQQNATIQELEKQRQLMTAKFDEMAQQTSMNYKENANKAQKKIAQLQNEVKKLKQVKFELSQNLKSTKDQLEQRNQRYERSEKKLKQQLNTKKRELENYKNELQLEKKKFQQQIQQEREKITRTKSTLTEDYKKQKDTITQLTEDLRKTKADSQTKQAQLEQRIKFSQDEKKFLKEQLEENKRLHQRAIQDLRMQNDQQVEEREKVRIEEVRTELTTEIKNVTITYENQKKKIVYEVESLRNTNKDLQLELKVARQQCQDEKHNYKQLQEQTTKKIESLEQQLRNLQRSKESTLMERENMLKKKIIDLEREIESIKEKYETEQRDTEEKNKQCIIQLRVTYERQRDDMENNYLRQKERAQRKYDEMVEQYETKHRQQIENMEEELQMVKEDAAFMEEDLRNTINELKYLVDSRDKDIQNLKNMLSELKATLGKKQQEFTRKVQHLTTSFKQQKQNLNLKLQSFQQQNNQLEKDVMNLNHEKQRLSNELQKTKTLLLQIQTQYNTKKQQFQIMTQNWKRKFSQKQNELMQFKINYQKQTALLSQENQHISQKNNQLQQQLNRINQVNEEKIRKIKSQAEETINTTIEKYSSERNHIQEKYDKVKKTFKETESALNKKLNQMQKERAVDSEKINNLQMKLATLEERKKMQIMTLEKQLQKLKELYRQEKHELSTQVNRLKDQVEEINRKKIEIQTRYDKDILLLRNQVQNEINIRQTREASYNENIRQLEARIQNLQRSKSSQQSKAQSTYNQQRVRIEQTYRTKITQSNKMIEKLTRDYDDLSKRYEYDLKDLKEMLAVQKQTKQSLQIKLDKKSNEWQQLERKLNHDIDVLKSERQQRGLEFQRQLEKEKQNLKLKLNDLENKLRATEKERTTQFMDYQKEKARFSQQQSSIAQEMEHLKDKIAKLQKDKTRLDKENQRLKIEKRNNKNASYIRFNTGLEERKSQITINTIRKEKMVEKKDSESKSQLSYNEDLLSSTNKENMVSQNNMLLE